MDTSNPLSILPIEAGDENAVQINKSQKSLLNKALHRAGYQANIDSSRTYTDWEKNDTVYRVYHGKNNSYVVKQKQEQTHAAEKTEPFPQPTPAQVKREGTTKADDQSDGTSSEASPSLFPSQDHDTDTFRPGMYVRVPVNLDRPDEEFREYYLGRIESLEEVSDTAVVAFEHHSFSGEIKRQSLECPQRYIHRCQILPDTTVVHVETGQTGTILCSCDNDFTPGVFFTYYVQLDGEIVTLSEALLIAGDHRGNPDPQLQLRNYEFQHPSFKFPRDQLVETYAELRTATFGLEDLVGSRIRLLAHQAEVVATVLGDPACRYILADEVGLGKTIEASVILKGLRRRHPQLQALILAPSALTTQWRYELDQKFWLRFATWSQWSQFLDDPTSPGLIISHEALATEDTLAFLLKTQAWGLIIVDEAHHLRKKPTLYEHIRDLSDAAERVLILSATPVQRRAEEFLSLLKLVDPTRYEHVDTQSFKHTIQAQHQLLKTIAAIVPDLSPDYFDNEYFLDDIAHATAQLPSDPALQSLIESVRESADHHDRGLQAAKVVVAYITENYQIERRVIRNRRASLDISLPKRVVDESFAYSPATDESEFLDNLYDYIDRCIEQLHGSKAVLEYGRVLLHAAFSSPEAVGDILTERQASLDSTNTTQERKAVTTPASPRQEPDRIRQLILSLPPTDGESQTLDTLLWHAQRWGDAVEDALDTVSFRQTVPSRPYRLSRVLQSVQQTIRDNRDAKIVIFSSWQQTLHALRRYLRQLYGSEALAEFHIDIEPSRLQKEADRFQREERCHILLCDELGGEGRNFQIADLIVHVDLPWSPIMIEQRIGRVDRLGREGTVRSVVPYAQEQLEADLYQIWQDAFALFTQSMSGLEIALEQIQDDLTEALRQSARNGVLAILPDMVEQAQTLAEQVEEERFYHQGTIDQRLRQQFRQLSETYRDGSRLRGPVLQWAEQAGLKHTYKAETDTVRYYPRRFNVKMMRNAKFVNVPNMEEALERSRHSNSPWITGTFNRAIAVVREDLVFFAPGSDSWTDAIINNTIEADRGRACAIHRTSTDVEEPWRGIELAYRLQIDPRSLFESAFPPIHLSRAQDYLQIPFYRLLVSIDGAVLPPSHPLYDVVQQPFSYKQDLHLGRRSGVDAPLATFKEVFSEERWRNRLDQLFQVAEESLADEFGFTEELADEAADNFAQEVRGLRAAHTWHNKYGVYDQETAQAELAAIERYEQISKALVSGIRTPLWQLESACFWVIEPEN